MRAYRFAITNLFSVLFALREAFMKNKIHSYAFVLSIFFVMPFGFAPSAASPNALIRGGVVSHSGEPIRGARVVIAPSARSAVTGPDGRFEFADVSLGRVTLSIQPSQGSSQTYFTLETVAGERIDAICPSPLPRDAQTILFRVITPTPEHNRTHETLHVGAQTNAGNQAFVNGEEIRVYNTGIFARDHIPLTIGNNPIRIEVRSPQGVSVARTRTIERIPAPTSVALPATPLRILERTLLPAEDRWVSPGDLIEARFHGSPDAQADFRIGDGPWRPMIELSPEESGGSRGQYVGAIIVQPGETWQDAQVQARLRSPQAGEPVLAVAPGKIAYLEPDIPRMAEVKSDFADLKVGLEQVRLGGPNFTIAPKGTRLRLTGKIGDMYRVQLAQSAVAWVQESDIELMPLGASLALGSITNLRIDGDESYVRIAIPNPQRVPYRIQTGSKPASLWIDLYGVTSNTTWLVTDPSAKGVAHAEWEQVEPHLYRLKVNFNYPHIWGYDASPSGGSLIVRVKRPPTPSSTRSPLAGLTIAVEAGHGGRDPGAIGLSGLTEKEVNLAAAEALIPILERSGARVVRIRVGDETVSLAEKTQRALDANADLFVSLHANAASAERGYYRVSGTSTYYHHPFARPFAEAVLHRLLNLDLESFGLVGHFNYRPIRMSQMPAILVEKAFLSHPGDEEKLADPDFRAKIAEAIAEGIEDYVRSALGD